MTLEGDFQQFLETGYLDLNERIRDRWANLGEILFNAYGIKEYWALEEALEHPILCDSRTLWGRIDFEEWKEQKSKYARSRKEGNAYSIPPVLVNLEGGQDFWLPTLEIKFRKIKDGSELPVPNDSNFAIRFPNSLKDSE